MTIEATLPMIGNALIIIGVFFVLTGALGLVRMPDFFTRLHPAGVADAAGIPLILIGLMFHSGLSLITGKLFLLMLFMLLTSPTACHALAKAAHLDEALKKKDKKAKEAADD